MNDAERQPAPQEPLPKSNRFSSCKRYLAERLGCLILLTKWLGAMAACTLSLLLTFFLLAWLASSVLVTHAQKRLEASWRQDFNVGMPLRGEPAREEANETARRLDRALEPLGFALSRPPRASRAERAKRKTGIWTVDRRLSAYFLEEVRSPLAPARPLPEEVERFLDENGAILEGARDILLGPSLPRWKTRPDRLQDAPLPYLSGCFKLHHLLWAMAIRCGGRGEPEESARYGRAAWRVALALAGRDEMICMLVDMAMVRQQAALARKAGLPPDEWRDQVRSIDIHARLMNSFQHEARVWYQLAERDRIDDQSDLNGIHGMWRTPLLGNYLRYQVLAMLDRWRIILRDLEEAGPYPVRPADFANRLVYPRWNILGRIATPEFYDLWLRGSITGLDLDLTSRALSLPASYGPQAAESTWTEPSGCGDLSWRFTRSRSGDLEIVCSEPLETWLDDGKARGLYFIRLADAARSPNSAIGSRNPVGAAPSPR
jgi:hypothetical protein